jgi:two-component system, response regulator PdtaR
LARGRLGVLIVEEKPLDGLGLEEAIVLAGHQVTGWATTLQNAIALAEARPPDLALINPRLRDGDTGIELSRRLSERGIAVVVMTAQPEQLDNLENILGVLPKPFATETVRQVLQHAGEILKR